MSMSEEMNEFRINAQDRLSIEKDISSDVNGHLQWFVMRDLKRWNAKLSAYDLFKSLKIQVFTPMVWKLVTRNGKRYRKKCLSCRTCFSCMTRRLAVDR